MDHATATQNICLNGLTPFARRVALAAVELAQQIEREAALLGCHKNGVAHLRISRDGREVEKSFDRPLGRQLFKD